MRRRNCRHAVKVIAVLTEKLSQSCKKLGEITREHRRCRDHLQDADERSIEDAAVAAVAAGRVRGHFRLFYSRPVKNDLRFSRGGRCHWLRGLYATRVRNRAAAPAAEKV